MNTLKKKHDKLAKQFLTNISMAQEFLIQYLPKELLAICDLNSLVIESGSYIENDLKSHCSDIVYKVNLTNVDRIAYIYVLIEHQSRAERLMPHRVIRYQLAIIQTYLDNMEGSKKDKDLKAVLPLVVPIVFYNGRRSPYPHSCDIGDLFSNKELYDKIGLGRFSLVDLTIKDDNELLRHGKLALLEVLLKHISERDIRDWARTIAQAFKIASYNNINDNLVEGTFHYLMAAREKAELEYILNEVRHEVPEYGEITMTYAEELRKEGEQKGMQNLQQQLIDKMLRAGEPLAKIAEYANISIEKLKQMGNK